MRSVEKTVTNRASYAPTRTLFLFDQQPVTAKQFSSDFVQTVAESDGLGMWAFKLRDGTVCLRNSASNGDGAKSRAFVVVEDAPHVYANALVEYQPAAGRGLVLSPGERGLPPFLLRVRPCCLHLNIIGADLRLAAFSPLSACCAGRISVQANDIVCRIPLCGALEYALLGMLAPPHQVIVNGITSGEKRSLLQQENMMDLLSKLRAFLYADARARLWKERQILAALVEAVHAKVNQDSLSERHSVAVRADPADLATLTAFTKEKGTWRKGVYSIELEDLSALGAVESWHWTSMAYKRDKALGRTDFEGAEIVSPKTSEPALSLLLFTDLRVVGLKFSRRVWADDGRGFLRGPALPNDRAPCDWNPKMAGPRV